MLLSRTESLKTSSRKLTSLLFPARCCFHCFISIPSWRPSPANPFSLSLGPPSHNPRDHSFPDTAGLLCSDRFSNAAVDDVCSGITTDNVLSFCCVKEPLFAISAGSSSRLKSEEAGRCSPYGWHTCGSPPGGIYYESLSRWDLNTV